MIQLKDYQLLLKRLAWSFHSTTGIEWWELYEAALDAYYNALQSYDQKKGTVYSTWLWRHVNQSLINFTKREKRHPKYHPALLEEQSSFRERLSQDAEAIVSIMMQNPQHFTSIGRKAALEECSIILQKHGWKMPRIWAAVKDLKLALGS